MRKALAFDAHSNDTFQTYIYSPSELYGAGSSSIIVIPQHKHRISSIGIIALAFLHSPLCHILPTRVFIRFVRFVRFGWHFDHQFEMHKFGVYLRLKDMNTYTLYTV